MQLSASFIVRFRGVTKNNPPIIAPNFGSYSRRGNRCILEYSPIAATKNTGQKASKMGILHLAVNTLKMECQTLVWRYQYDHLSFAKLKFGTPMKSVHYFYDKMKDAVRWVDYFL